MRIILKYRQNPLEIRSSSGGTARTRTAQWTSKNSKSRKPMPKITTIRWHNGLYVFISVHLTCFMSRLKHDQEDISLHPASPAAVQMARRWLTMALSHGYGAHVQCWPNEAIWLGNFIIQPSVELVCVCTCTFVRMVEPKQNDKRKLLKDSRPTAIVVYMIWLAPPIRVMRTECRRAEKKKLRHIISHCTCSGVNFIGMLRSRSLNAAISSLYRCRWRA